MPKKRALRQFKAALFETLSHPIRIAIMKRLLAGELEAHALISSLGEVEEAYAADHVSVLVGNRIVTRRIEHGKIYYAISDPSLGAVVDLIQDGAAWPVALAYAVRIEILEFLLTGEVEQEQLIARIEREDRPEALHHLQALVDIRLVSRRVERQRVLYSLSSDLVPRVLKLLKDYFETHLVESLLLVSQMSFQHIKEEAQQLKARLAVGEAKKSSERKIDQRFSL